MVSAVTIVLVLVLLIALLLASILAPDQQGPIRDAICELLGCGA